MLFRSGEVKALEFPFMVSLEMPSCSFEDMVLQALEEGKYHLYERADDEAHAKVVRQSSLRSQAPRPPLQTRASKLAPVSRAAHDGGAAGNGSSPATDVVCAGQPMDFMAADVVMVALDKDGDGALSWHETCLSDADFVAAARLCTGCGEAASRLACLRAGAVGFESVCRFYAAALAAARGARAPECGPHRHRASSSSVCPLKMGRARRGVTPPGWATAGATASA